jgi:protein-histidine N-methyltransferase
MHFEVRSRAPQWTHASQDHILRRGAQPSCSYTFSAPRPRRRTAAPFQSIHVRPQAAPRPRASSVFAATAADDVAAYDRQLRWCVERHSLPPPAIEPAQVDDVALGRACVGYVATRSVEAGEPLLIIPGDLGVTSVDVDKDPELAPLAQGRSELVGLALWLAKERSRRPESTWAPLVSALPKATDTPILWDDAERATLLRGSPILAESRAREATLRQEWAEIAELLASKHGSSESPTSELTEASFLEAFSVVLSHAAYLPSAQCFALLPLVGGLPRTGSASGAELDYDADRQAAVLVATKRYSPGQEVRLADGRPNGELLLATGTLEPLGPSDCLEMEAGLVAADRLYSAKRQVLESMGYTVPHRFPLFPDRLATQHLAYLRLSRVSDPMQLVSVKFDEDSVVSPENEYEILQLMMGDLRER